MPTSPEVESWSSTHENSMNPLVLRTREVILSRDPRMPERIIGKAPTFTYQGNLARLFPKSKQPASLMFHSWCDRREGAS